MSETYISVYLQPSGPIPGEFSLLTLGACLIKNPTKTFYFQLQPINSAYIPDMVNLTGLSWGELKLNGEEPQQGMKRLKKWVEKHEKPVFIALNSSLPWMFIDYYFMKYSGSNPFGHNALDLRSYAMGKLKTRWYPEQFQASSKNSPDSPTVIEQALYQAQLFQLLFEVD